MVLSGVLLSCEAVLDGEEGGSGSRGDADLPVGVLDVGVGSLGRHTEGTSDLLGLQSARQQRDDLPLSGGQAGWSLDPRHRLAGRLQYGADGIRVEAATAGLRGESLERPAPANRPRDGPWARSARGSWSAAARTRAGKGIADAGQPRW